MGILSLMSFGAACGSRQTAQPPATAAKPPSAKPPIGEPCAPPRAQAATPAGAESLRVFVELAEVHLDLARPADPAQPMPARWIDDERLRVAWSGHLLAHNGKAASMAWNDRTISVTPYVTRSEHREVRLDLTLDPPLPWAPERVQDPRERGDAQLSIVLQDQQMLVVGLQTRGEALAVTPYVIENDDDLRRVMECKRRPR